jgi:hypothetical protein
MLMQPLYKYSGAFIECYSSDIWMGWVKIDGNVMKM